MSDHWPGDNDFGDLDGFSGEYRPEHAFRGGIDTLPDGPYDFEVQKAVLDRTPNSGDRICRIQLQVLGGRVVEWTHFLTNQPGVNRLCAELAVLGFDAERWGKPGRELSKEIPAAVARLQGMKFRAMKTSRKDTRPGMEHKVYHDLQISAKIDGRPMPPLAPPPNGTHTAKAAATADDEDIPF